MDREPAAKISSPRVTESILSLLRLTLGFGGLVWIAAFIMTDVSAVHLADGGEENYSWDFREAMVLFIFGLAALLAAAAGVAYLVKWIVNLLRGSFAGSAENGWSSVAFASLLLGVQLASFAAIPSIKKAAFQGYRHFTELSERSTYDVDRDTAMRRYLERTDKLAE